MTGRRDNLAGEVALVTGASRGLSLLLARELARRSVRLVICARDEAELERAAGWLRALLHLTHRLLPAPGGKQQTTPGRQLRPVINDRVFAWLTSLGRSAARRFNQQPATSRPGRDWG